jgi:aminomethyltransferase
VLAGGTDCGEVKSGTLSPTLGKCIATAMIDARVDEAAPLVVDIRGNKVGATRIPMPFYVRKDRS